MDIPQHLQAVRELARAAQAEFIDYEATRPTHVPEELTEAVANVLHAFADADLQIGPEFYKLLDVADRLAFDLLASKREAGEWWPSTAGIGGGRTATRNRRVNELLSLFDIFEERLEVPPGPPRLEAWKDLSELKGMRDEQLARMAGWFTPDGLPDLPKVRECRAKDGATWPEFAPVDSAAVESTPETDRRLIQYVSGMLTNSHEFDRTLQHA